MIIEPSTTNINEISLSIMPTNLISSVIFSSLLPISSEIISSLSSQTISSEILLRLSSQIPISSEIISTLSSPMPISSEIISSLSSQKISSEIPLSLSSQMATSSEIISSLSTQMPISSEISSEIVLSLSSQKPTSSEIISTPSSPLPISSEIISSLSTQIPISSEIISSTSTQMPISSEIASSLSSQTISSEILLSLSSQKPVSSETISTLSSPMPTSSEIISSLSTQMPILSEIVLSLSSKIPISSEISSQMPDQTPSTIGPLLYLSETSTPSADPQASLGTLQSTLIVLLAVMSAVLVLIITALALLICYTRRLKRSSKQYCSKLNDGNLTYPYGSGGKGQDSETGKRPRLQTHLTLINGKIFIQKKPRAKDNVIPIDEQHRLSSVIVHSDNDYEYHQAGGDPSQAFSETKDTIEAKKIKEEIALEENNIKSAVTPTTIVSCEPKNDMEPEIAEKACDMHEEPVVGILPEGNPRSSRDLTAAIENTKVMKSVSNVKTCNSVTESSKEIIDSDQENNIVSPLACLLPTSKQDKKPKLKSVIEDTSPKLPQADERLVKKKHEKKKDLKGNILLDTSEVIANTEADFEIGSKDMTPVSNLGKKKLLLPNSTKASTNSTTEATDAEERSDKDTASKASAAAVYSSGGEKQLPKINVSAPALNWSVSPKSENWSLKPATTKAHDRTPPPLEMSSISTFPTTKESKSSEASKLKQDIPPRSPKLDLQNPKPSSVFSLTPEVKKKAKSPLVALKRNSWDTGHDVEVTPSLNLDVSKEPNSAKQSKRERPRSEICSPKSKFLEKVSSASDDNTNRNDGLKEEIKKAPSIEERKKKISLAGLKAPDEGSVHVQPKDSRKSPPAKDTKSKGAFNVANGSELKSDKRSSKHLPVLKKLSKELQQQTSKSSSSVNPNSKSAKHLQDELKTKIKEGLSPQFPTLENSDSLSQKVKKMLQPNKISKKCDKSTVDSGSQLAAPKHDRVDSKQDSSKQDSKLEPTPKKVPLIPVRKHDVAAKKRSTDSQEEPGEKANEDKNTPAYEERYVQQDGRINIENWQAQGQDNIYDQVSRVKIGETPNTGVVVGGDGYVTTKDIATRRSKLIGHDKEEGGDGYVPVDIPAHCSSSNIALEPNLAYAASKLGDKESTGVNSIRNEGSSAPATSSTLEPDGVALHSNLAYEPKKFDGVDSDAKGSAEANITDTCRLKTSTLEEENAYEYVHIIP